jgi:hypothetical protein
VVKHPKMYHHVGFFSLSVAQVGRKQQGDADGRLRFNQGQLPGERNLSVPVQVAHLGPREEHVAQLVDLRRFGLLPHCDNLLDECVAAVFGLASGEAVLLALSFHAKKFTPARAATWLGERGFRPLHFVTNKA